MDVVERFRAAVESRDLAAFDGLFADDVQFFSPVKFTPFVGAPAVRALLAVLLRTFENFRYVGELTGEADGHAVHQLIFRASVAGKEIHGIDLFRLDDDGLIGEFTVMVRPLSATIALKDAVNAAMGVQR
jgi:ketosteroid isomerase-like protein